MGRPFKHKVSELIAEGHEQEAREIVGAAIADSNGRVRVAAKRLGASSSAMWRWVAALGLASFYDGREGAASRWAKVRAEKRKAS